MSDKTVCISSWLEQLGTERNFFLGTEHRSAVTWMPSQLWPQSRAFLSFTGSSPLSTSFPIIMPAIQLSHFGLCYPQLRFPSCCIVSSSIQIFSIFWVSLSDTTQIASVGGVRCTPLPQVSEDRSLLGPSSNISRQAKLTQKVVSEWSELCLKTLLFTFAIVMIGNFFSWNQLIKKCLEETKITQDPFKESIENVR